MGRPPRRLSSTAEQAELVVHQISEILAVHGRPTLVGPLPAALQKVTTYAAGLRGPERGAQGRPARLPLAFLARPALESKLAAAGLEASRE